MYLADAIQSAEENLVEVSVVQQMSLLVDYMLHHGIDLHRAMKGAFQPAAPTLCMLGRSPH